MLRPFSSAPSMLSVSGLLLVSGSERRCGVLLQELPVEEFNSLIANNAVPHQVLCRCRFLASKHCCTAMFNSDGWQRVCPGLTERMAIRSKWLCPAQMNR